MPDMPDKVLEMLSHLKYRAKKEWDIAPSELNTHSDDPPKSTIFFEKLGHGGGDSTPFVLFHKIMF